MLAVFNKNYFKKSDFDNQFFFFVGYGDRRRYNDNESTTYDAQEMDGNLILKCIIQSNFSFILEGQQQYNDPYFSQRYRYGGGGGGGSRNNRGGGGNYRYNNNSNNNLNEYYEDSYITSGQSQQIPTKKSQQTSSNNGVDSNDVSTAGTINGGGGPKGQRTSKQQSNGVK
jgi:hypothetical protein